MRIITSAALALMVLATPAMAGEVTCDFGPQDQWMTPEAITAVATDLGYEVRSVKAEGGCYELYAISPEGQRAEIAMNPVTGELVSGSESE